MGVRTKNPTVKDFSGLIHIRIFKAVSLHAITVGEHCGMMFSYISFLFVVFSFSKGSYCVQQIGSILMVFLNQLPQCQYQQLQTLSFPHSTTHSMVLFLLFCLLHLLQIIYIHFRTFRARSFSLFERTCDICLSRSVLSQLIYFLQAAIYCKFHSFLQLNSILYCIHNVFIICPFVEGCMSFPFPRIEQQ